jgi:integrase/recombinase XerD
MQLITALEDFLTYLELHKGRSIRTLEQYEFHIWRFIAFLHPECETLEKTHGFSHRKVFLDRESKDRTKNTALRSLLQKEISGTIEEVTKAHINTFRLNLKRDGLSVKSINAHIITLRSWLKYLKKQEIECLDPTVLDLMKPPDREVTFLTQEEIDRFFLSIDTTSIQGKRDMAIALCIYSTGLRISELTGLDRKDINLDLGEFAVRGKG